MRKILITNDDGIESEGLLRLVNVAKDYGEIWIVAPDDQRSACSHSITVHGTIDIYPYDYKVDGVNAFVCSGTPGDCVRVGSLSVMPYRPDVVLSGINKGYNAATDIQYSGTCGAAFEASFQGYLGIAISEGFRGVHEVTDKYLRELLEEVIDKKLDLGQIWNINFPECPLTEFRGILRDRTPSHGKFYDDSYKVIEELPGDGKRYVIDGREVRESEEGSDLRALFDNCISIGVVDNVAL
ncbi:5'-nucleotidase /3'-nucleotidase /exopolyphosphatase [Lachnospiraceae bacterium]|nr:5'-nucleotidase /3'-nucleotidase /exopolyphosphatase [Lachnospiraceae bacterium]